MNRNHPPSTGLIGTPNANQKDDWMTSTGKTIEIPDWKELKKLVKIDEPNPRHQLEYNYCLANHCVDEEDSIMTIPGEWTWDDVKCKQLIYEPPHIDNCVISEEVINATCKDTRKSPLSFVVDMLQSNNDKTTSWIATNTFSTHIPFCNFYLTADYLKYSCHLDCCYGGCKEAPEELCEENDCEKLDEDEDPNKPRVDDECSLTHTGDSICPDRSVVKILHTRGAESHGYTPEASQIIHNIRFVEDTDTVQLRVNNPFDHTTNIWVKHEVHSSVDGFLNDKCDVVPGAENCVESGEPIEIACHNHEDKGFSFALVSVYFSSESFTPSENKVDQCCKDDDGNVADASHGVVEVTFEIICGCPASEAQ